MFVVSRKCHQKFVQCGLCLLAWAVSGLVWVAILWTWTASANQSCAPTQLWDRSVSTYCTYWRIQKRTHLTASKILLLAFSASRSSLIFPILEQIVHYSDFWVSFLLLTNLIVIFCKPALSIFLMMFWQNLLTNAAVENPQIFIFFRTSSFFVHKLV